MRILVAGIIGGLAMFLWSAVAHMALPIGEMGMKVPTGQASAIAALGPTTQGAGVYMYPSMPAEDWQDEEKMKAFAASAKDQPYAFVVYQPGGNPVNASMTPQLVRQYASDTAGALLLAWVLSLVGAAFGRRVLVGAALGLFSWLAVNVPYWNWYMFPGDFTFGALLEQVIGWTLAAAACAWWLKRGERR